MQQQRALIDQTSAQNYPAFLKEVTRFFQLSKKAFLTKTFFSAKDYVNPAPAYRLLQAHTFNVAQGAIYGQASNSLRDRFLRLTNRNRSLKKFICVGGTVHLGRGSPIVVKGGYEVAKCIVIENTNCIKT